MLIGHHYLLCITYFTALDTLNKINYDNLITIFTIIKACGCISW